MRVAEVLEIVQGELLNTPSISSFHSLSTRLETLKRGDLFLARHNTLIDEAIHKGAYGIVFSGQIKMHDHEIAWIRVDSIQEAAIRLIRYTLTSKGSQVALLPSLEWKIAQKLLELKSSLFFEGEPINLLETALKESYEWLFFHEKPFERIAPTILRSTPPLEEPFEVTSYTLFDSKIFFEGHHHTLPLPRLFLKPLANVVHFFKTHTLPFSLAKMEAIDTLHPCFLNTRGKITKHGQSNKVVIAEPDLEAFERYVAYLKLNAKWAKILFLIPKPYLEIFENIDFSKSYQSKEELLSLIQNEEYHFALILGVNLAFLQERLKEDREEASLF
ncbi:hypothetical protein [Wolinella succinogenes]|uniref:Uncharacterized protein n=1 Tax=Wolinella succinogenes (strain ATCC 29543 / DSM 1740 / CCUG 13145 / JCM 31913 / LMG 7466 / NCTC 11488 / FDC 602W) TaxID=273121 RepID=Q7MSQ7_WOLSU|nr:hypothetical protein [Wolinella succinogenes]CAE09374.1 conserved hypothetical protein [Wolinella succinogenes]VEG81587.1 Uncharacterised protein [Wolinella succinogenes]HCZ18896.1 hypothetical protein [Helicobacter sp.]